MTTIVAPANMLLPLTESETDESKPKAIAPLKPP